MRPAQAYATSLDDAYIALLAIEKTSGAFDRFTDYDVDVVHGGQIYAAHPFQVTLPDATESAPPMARLRFDNVPRHLVPDLRLIRSPLAVTLKIVLASDPGTVEIGPLDFEIRDARWTGTAIECDLTYEPILAMAVPAGTFSPADFPGLFK